MHLINLPEYFDTPYIFHKTSRCTLLDALDDVKVGRLVYAYNCTDNSNDVSYGSIGFLSKVVVTSDSRVIFKVVTSETGFEFDFNVIEPIYQCHCPEVLYRSDIGMKTGRLIGIRGVTGDERCYVVSNETVDDTSYDNRMCFKPEELVFTENIKFGIVLNARNTDGKGEV